MDSLKRGELIAQSERLLTFGAAWMSGILAPIILGAVSLGLLELMPRWSELIRYAFLAIPLGAFLGGAAMHLGLRTRSSWVLVGVACAGGVLFLGGTAVLYAVLEASVRWVFAAILIFGLYGSIFSLPCGLLFGLVLLAMFGLAQRHLENPPEDVVARIACIVARVLFASAALALFAVWMVEAPYIAALASLVFETTREHVDVDSCAWTRLLAATPLAMVGLALELYGRVHMRGIHRTRPLAEITPAEG